MWNSVPAIGGYAATTPFEYSAKSNQHFQAGEYLNAAAYGDAIVDWARGQGRNDPYAPVFFIFSSVRIANCYLALGYPHPANARMEDAEEVLRATWQKRRAGSVRLGRDALGQELKWQEDFLSAQGSSEAELARLARMREDFVKALQVASQDEVRGERESLDSYHERMNAEMGIRNPGPYIAVD